MRHRHKGRKLGRTNSHKKALLRNLANQIIEHKEIRTTLAKAKEMRGVVDRLITYGKKGEHHHRRLAFAFLRKKETVTALFDEIAPAYSDREGGYSRVLKLGRRQGDGAELGLVQLVGFEKLGDAAKPAKKKKTTRKQQTEKKETAAETQVEEKSAAEETGVEEVVEEKPVVEEAPAAEAPEKAEEKSTTEEATNSEQDKPDAEEKKDDK